MENANFIDTDYTTARADEKRSYNQIRAKSVSRENMTRKYKKFTDKIKKELEEAQKDLVQDTYEVSNDGSLASDADNKLLDKTVAVAKLEGIINVLTEIPVESNFLSSRAIKLRSNMINNFKYNSGVAYIVAEQQESIFATEEENSLVENVEDTYQEMVTPVDDDQNGVADVVDKALDNNVVEPIEIPERGFVPVVDDMESVVVNNEEVIPVQEEVAPTQQDSIIPVQEVVADEASRVDGNVVGTDQLVDDNTIAAPGEDENISNSDIDEIVNEFMDKNESIKEAAPNDLENEKAINITKNESTEAKIDKYDSEGMERQRYVYTPLTDEEIDDSKEKLALMAENAEVERDLPLVAPEREMTESYEKEKVEEDNNLHFDYSDVTEEDVEKMVAEPKSIEDLKLLIKAVKEREAQLKTALGDKEKGEKTLENINKQADLAEQAKNKSEATYTQMFGDLRRREEDLSREIETTNEENENLRNSIAEKERYIAEQEEQKRQTDEMISQIKEAFSLDGDGVIRR